MNSKDYYNFKVMFKYMYMTKISSYMIIVLIYSKMVLDASLLNTQHYKIWIKGK